MERGWSTIPFERSAALATHCLFTRPFPWKLNQGHPRPGCALSVQNRFSPVPSMGATQWKANGNERGSAADWPWRVARRLSELGPKPFFMDALPELCFQIPSDRSGECARRAASKRATTLPDQRDQSSGKPSCSRCSGQRGSPTRLPNKGLPSRALRPGSFCSRARCSHSNAYSVSPRKAWSSAS